MSKVKKTPKDWCENPETLDQVPVGMMVWVTSVEVQDESMRRRLQDLGIVNGTRVVCKQRAPSGNPKSFLVRGAVIAIRKEDSSQIHVTNVHPEQLSTPL